MGLAAPMPGVHRTCLCPHLSQNCSGDRRVELSTGEYGSCALEKALLMSSVILFFLFFINTEITKALIKQGWLHHSVRSCRGAQMAAIYARRLVGAVPKVAAGRGKCCSQEENDRKET